MSILAYIGPDTMLPLASGFAAIVGAILLFGRTLWVIVKKPFVLLFGKRSGTLSAEPVTDHSSEPVV